MDEPTKRAWNRPELTVLVRGGAEEAVLVGCKVLGSGEASPFSDNVACPGNALGSCGSCSTTTDS